MHIVIQIVSRYCRNPRNFFTIITQLYTMFAQPTLSLQFEFLTALIVSDIELISILYIKQSPGCIH